MQWRVVAWVLIILFPNYLLAQNCTALGQTPASAFPVCGESVFTQTTVPICGNTPVSVPGCPGGGYSDKNPFWYQFTCFTAGTLDFQITPIDLGDDYDWMLYDITGRNPSEVFTNTNLIVTGNWSGSSGITGASPGGITTIQCGSDPSENRPTFARSPTLIEGHTYLLLVSHFTDSQSGYKLSFGGGSAVITDPKLPALASASAACGGTILRVKLNKKMKCSSLAADGSDFTLTPAAGTITGATGVGCAANFDLDSVILTTSGIIAPGVYNISMKKGSDGTTLRDNCDREITEGASLPVTIFPIVPTPMDSLSLPVLCEPDEIQVFFRGLMRCNSIAADGSDFVIPGLPVGIRSAAGGTCTNGLSPVVIIKLTGPVQTAGNWNIQLRQGSDGNTIIDECGMPTPAGSNLNFATADTVNAGFTYNVLWGCKKDTVECFHPGGNGVNEWAWNFDNIGNSQQQNAGFIFPTFGNKKIVLNVTNGVCRDSAETMVVLDNAMNARFGGPIFQCPEDLAVFTDSSTGKIVSWNWTFGNGHTSTQQLHEPQRYPRPAARTRKYTVQLVVQNDKNCLDTAYHQVEVVTSCYITIPTAFSPNGDNNNDYLYPMNAFKATDLLFRIYNRYGQLVFETKDWMKRWDGNFNGQQQPSGTYVWTLSYTHTDTKQKIIQKGATTLIR